MTLMLVILVLRMGRVFVVGLLGIRIGPGLVPGVFALRMSELPMGMG